MCFAENVACRSSILRGCDDEATEISFIQKRVKWVQAKLQMEYMDSRYVFEVEPDHGQFGCTRQSAVRSIMFQTLVKELKESDNTICY